MILTLAVNNKNDIYIQPDGNLALAADQEAVLQICARVAKTQLGELVLNITRGIPNFQLVWSGAPNFPQFEAALRKALIAVTGVIEITQLNISLSDNNVLSYQAVIKTIYGSGALNGNI